MAIYKNNGTLAYKDKNGDIQILYPDTKLDSILGIEYIKEHVEDAENPHGVRLPHLGVLATATEVNSLEGIKDNVQSQINLLNTKIDTAANDASAGFGTVIEEMQKADSNLSTSFDEKLNTHAEEMNAIIDSKSNKEATFTVTLPASAWGELGVFYTQDVSAIGVTENNTVFIAPSVSSMDSYLAYSECVVVCSAQVKDTLTFIARTKPEIDLIVSVAILNA